jgi:CheY-like chemotaxis protein
VRSYYCIITTKGGPKDLKWRQIKMTNENKKPRLLIVEDNLENLANAHDAAKERGYEVDLALDLEDALAFLDSNNYQGVITDMCFLERGNHGAGFRDEEMPTEAVEAQNKNQQKEKIVKGEFAQVIQNKSLENSNFDLYSRVEDGLYRGVLNTNESDMKDKITNSRTPALGYFVVEKAKEKGIPTTIISSLGHAINAFPAICLTELISEEEWIKHTKRKDKKYCGTISEEFIEDTKRWYNENISGGMRKFSETMEDLYEIDNIEEMKPKLKAEMLKIRECHGFIFDKAILLNGNKQKFHYNLAIDQLEGKIDETRPYTV